MLNINFQVLIKLLWCVAIGTPILVDYVYSFYETIGRSSPYDAFYTAIKRIVWGCSISWIIFACHKLKSGGIFRTILSHPMWLPLSKMSLSIYLGHYVHILLTTFNSKHFYNFGLHFLMHNVPYDFAVALFLALILYLFVEAPSILIVRHFVR